MTELYRGLLQILVMRCIEQIESLRTHIRSHNSGITENFELDIGVAGFWNLMLEIVLTIFAILCLLLGVILIAGLAVGFYPLHAVVQYSSLLLRNTRNPPPEVNNIKTEESPVVIKKEK